MRNCMILFLAMWLIGCGGNGTGGPDGSGGGSGGGAMSGLTDAQRVSIFCSKTLGPHCAQWFATEAQCEDLLGRTMNSLCEAKWEAETDCLATTTASDWTCDAVGQPMIANTRCRDQFGYGSYCRAAVATQSCYGAVCTFSSDCGAGKSCNDATKHCFSQSAKCGGLPCTYSSDCPTGFTCNSAAGQCVKQ